MPSQDSSLTPNTVASAPLKVAIVGCGEVVQTMHSPALVKLEQKGVLKVVGIHDPLAEAQKRVLEKFPTATAVAHLKDFVDLGVDFAIVASPHHLHAQQSIELLQSGISVLCEKPMATSVADAEAMIEAARKHQVHLAIGLLGRYLPSSEMVQKMLDSGILGQPVSIEHTRGGRGSAEKKSTWHFQKDLAGGGVLITVGIHSLDALIAWFGEPTRIVSYEDDAQDGVEASCIVRLEFAGSVNAELKLSRDFYMPNSTLIRASKGWMRQESIDALRLNVTDCVHASNKKTHECTEHITDYLSVSSEPPETDLFLLQLKNFTDALLGRADLLVPGSEGIKSLRVVEQCYHVKEPLSPNWHAGDKSPGSVSPSTTVRAREMMGMLRKLKKRLLGPNKRQQWPEFTQQEFLALRSTFLESASWSGGDEVQKFNTEFTSYLGVKYGVPVNSGTSALEIAVAAGGIGPGDEVIVPSYTFYSSASCIAKAGAKPVFVDVSTQDSCIDTDALEKAVTERTRAVVVVHFGGHPADMENILRICKQHKLILIEDAAHAAGSEWNSQKLGTIGDFGCFSFHASKPLASGEGGFLATNNGAFFEKAQALADFGILPDQPRAVHSMLGSNVRISKFQAAILSMQLKKLDTQIDRREESVNLLSALLKDIPGITPSRRADYATRHNHYIFSFLFDAASFGGLSKQEFAGRLKEKGIPCLEGYPFPLYEQPVFKQLDISVFGPNGRHESALKLCQSLVGLDQGFLLKGRGDMLEFAYVLKTLQATASKT